jgi:tRNA threonylcarbamoyladenosine biosynthesis protein TsaB
VCGELDGAGLKALADHNRAVHVVSPALRLRRAGYLAELGWRRLAQGEQDNLATLQPIYLHTV